MFAKRIDHYYLIRLEKGEEIIETLTNFCRQNKIFSGYIQGLGAVLDAELALYSLSQKKYFTKIFQGDYEIINLFGTISEPKLHLHLTLGDQEMRTFGGHLKKGIVSVLAEIILVPGSLTIKRKMNLEIGQEVLDLD
jgi:hypothetical protein